MIDTKYYRQAIIVGETTDLTHRQYAYTPGKGMPMPRTGDLISHAGAKGLLWPFLDYFEAPGDLTDTRAHAIFRECRPFKDFVYPIRDRAFLHTKEAFGFWSGAPLEESVATLKRLLLEYLGV